MHKIIFFTLLILINLPQAFAGGSLIGTGGKGVACFDANVATAILDGKLTKLGKKSLSSVEPLEYFFAKSNYQKDSAFEKIMDLSYQEALNTLHDIFKPFPQFYSELIKTSEFLGPIENGSLGDFDLKSTPDSLDIIMDTTHCATVQIVNSYASWFVTNIIFWKKMNNAQKAVMQWHEEVYFMARKYSDPEVKDPALHFYVGPLEEKSSLTTRMLVEMLMNNDP